MKLLNVCFIIHSEQNESLTTLFVSLQRHVYQPLFTLVGGGLKKVSEAEKWMKDVLPKYCVHYPTKVMELDPEVNQVTLENGQVVMLRADHSYKFPFLCW